MIKVMITVILTTLLVSLVHSTRNPLNVYNIVMNPFFVPMSDPPTPEAPTKHYKNGNIENWDCYCPETNKKRKQNQSPKACEIYLTTWALAGMRPDDPNRYVAKLDSHVHPEVEQLLTITTGGIYTLYLEVGLMMKSKIKSLLTIYLGDRNVFSIDVKEQDRKRYQILVPQVAVGEKLLRIKFYSDEKNQQGLISDIFFGKKVHRPAINQ